MNHTPYPEEDNGEIIEDISQAILSEFAGEADSSAEVIASDSDDGAVSGVSDETKIYPITPASADASQAAIAQQEEAEDEIDAVIANIAETITEAFETSEETGNAESNSADQTASGSIESAAQAEQPNAPGSVPSTKARRKGRPRYRSSEGLLGIPNILSTVVWAALVLVIGITLGRMLWICAAEVLAFGRENKTVTIAVYDSDTIDDITEKLYNGGLIHYPGLFKLYAKFAVDDGEIHSGIWDLNTKYDYHALVKMMNPGSTRTVVTVMIPEGYSCRQIFALLQENKVCNAKDLEAYAANGELEDFWFLEGIERGSKYSLEGYLFPDTYEFYTNSTAKTVLEKMLSNFDNRYSEEMKEALPALNERLTKWMKKDGKSEEYISEHLFTLKDIVIVASMIEKETANAKEGYTVSSVIYNRLYNWGDTPAYLNIDATIVYALDGKTDLTAEDLKFESPYNTYLYTGMIPGPISNPGTSSLLAALNPENTNYYYYVLDPSTGTHHFSRTLDEHNAFRASIG